MSENKKPLHKRVWVWVVAVIAVPLAIGMISAVGEIASGEYASPASTQQGVPASAPDTDTIIAKETQMPASDVPDYRVESVEDISSSVMKRARYIVRVPDRKLSHQDITKIAMDILKITDDLDAEGFAVFVFCEGDYTGAGPTVGGAEYNIDGAGKLKNITAIKSWNGAPDEDAFKTYAKIMEKIYSDFNRSEDELLAELVPELGMSVEDMKTLIGSVMEYTIPSSQ